MSGFWERQREVVIVSALVASVASVFTRVLIYWIF